MTPLSPMSTASRPTVREALAKAVFFVKMSFLLDDLPRRRSRVIVKDLRTHLADAAPRRGWGGALADLGPARILAQEYKDAEGGHFPRTLTGGAVALMVGLVWSLSTLSYAFGMLDAINGVAGSSGGRAEASGTYLWTEVAATASAEGLAAQFSGVGPLLMVAGSAMAYLVSARIWRVWGRVPQ